MFCPVQKETSLFVRFLVQGKSPEEATELLDGPEDADDNPAIQTYDIKTF